MSFLFGLFRARASQAYTVPEPCRSVRTYLIGLVLACLMPGILGAGLLLLNEYRSSRDQQQRDTIQTTRALVQTVDAYLLRLQTAAQTLATSDAFVRRDFALFHRQALEVVAISGMANNIVVTEPDGQQVVNTAKEFGEPLPRVDLKKDFPTIQLVFDTGKPAVSDLVFGPVLKRSLITISAPVFLNGKVAYVVNVATLPKHFNTILTSQGLPATWVAGIFDTTGTIVGRTHDADRFVGQKGTAELILGIRERGEGVLEMATRESIPVYGVFSRSSVTNWGVGIGIPRQEVAAKQEKVLSTLAVGVLGLFGIGFVLASIFGGRLSGSIGKLKALAGALGRGEEVSLPAFPVQEVNEVANAMDEAARLLRDRTEALRLAEARFRTLYDANLIGIVVANGKGEVIEANEYTLEVVGHTRDELEKGQVDWRQLTPPEWLPADEKALAELAATGVCTPYEKEYLRCDCSRRSVLLFDAMLPGDQGDILVVMLDITSQKQAQREVERLNADLERRVEERTAELSAANRELEAFTFATSHDLKGPLARINSFTTLLERSCRDHLKGDSFLFLDIIRQNASRLMLLVDDLLSHARIAQQTLELQSIDISDTVESIVREKVQETVDLKGEVRVNVPPAKVLADAHALGQVLGNLVENALKYSSQAAQPHIEIGGAVIENRVRIWVKDNGIGFDMKYHDRIFEIFKRLHSQSEYTGSGVGLALVKRAVERMGGTVWAESSPGQGASFFLELQLAS